MKKCVFLEVKFEMRKFRKHQKDRKEKSKADDFLFFVKVKRNPKLEIENCHFSNVSFFYFCCTI